jgi:hypothetical protein
MMGAALLCVRLAQRGVSALQRAVSRQHVSVVRALLRHGANPNAQVCRPVLSSALQ